MTKDVAVVVQTHWDREWYYPHQTFLARLLRVMKHVVEQLDAGQLQGFLFDGQVSAIEDFYRAAEPVLAQRVSQYVKAGHIVIGPWYIMADEFLSSGESLVRNLELGMARAAKHGYCQRIGYLPDTFGHIAQMPQILCEFGIDEAVVWRGIDAKQSEVVWQAPNGSSIFTAFLTEGYYQHPFNTADWCGALDAYLEKIVNCSGGELLLTQGGDHLLTVEDLQKKIDLYNAEQDEYRLVQRSLEDHIGRLRRNGTRLELPVVNGELRDNQLTFVLPDVLSTRQYLKVQNQLVEDRLTGQIEPLLAISQPEQYPRHYLEKTWQLLIEQQAHDSICGCSIDEVHREMEVRFSQLHQRLDALQHQAQMALGMRNDCLSAHRNWGAPSPFADDSQFTLFNPSPKSRQGWQCFDLFLSGRERTNITLRTVAGESLPTVLLGTEKCSEFHSPVDDFPEKVAGYRYLVAINFRLSGLQMVACEAIEPNWAKPAVAAAEWIENSYYQISVNGDWLQLTDKRSGRCYEDMLSLVSEMDAGDTYNFSPVGEKEYRAEIVSARGRCFDSENLGVQVQVLDIGFRLRQPQGLTEERNIQDERVESSGRLRLRLMPDDDLIEAQLDWHNNARDQRLRLHFALGQLVADTSADCAFHWLKRAKVYRDSAPVSGQREAPVAVFPSQSAITAGPLGFVHRGLHEGEIVSVAGEDRLAVTLVRSVGWLSRTDLKTRGLGAGPNLATPEAQCLRPHKFEFAFTLQKPESRTLLNRANSWRKPVMGLRGHVATACPELHLQENSLQVSSLRSIEWDGVPTLELRLWNPSGGQVEAKFNTAGFTRVDLSGRALNETMVVTPHQIATFIIPLAKLPFGGGAL
ncbi:hypothetical protein [Microbulbifer sp. TYP-18]|uniref:glycoside hydrolase family 38 N-terminal domain-containing protein n=1 Tax=Microbulbifer sp. TYP-18 TaxID=3230024 RepID=UPI0034C5E6F4